MVVVALDLSTPLEMTGRHRLEEATILGEMVVAASSLVVGLVVVSCAVVLHSWLQLVFLAVELSWFQAVIVVLLLAPLVAVVLPLLHIVIASAILVVLLSAVADSLLLIPPFLHTSGGDRSDTLPHVYPTTRQIGLRRLPLDLLELLLV